MANYNTTLQTNNTDLQSILDKVNALPEAGSGGTSVETCTVTITISDYYVYGVYYTALVDGEPTPLMISNTYVENHTIDDVVVGSGLVIWYTDGQAASVLTITGGELIHQHCDMYSMVVYISVDSTDGMSIDIGQNTGGFL